MLKTTWLSDLALKAFKTDDNKIVEGSRTNKMVVNLSKNLTYMLNIGAIGEPIFLISNA